MAARYGGEGSLLDECLVPDHGRGERGAGDDALVLLRETGHRPLRHLDPDYGDRREHDPAVLTGGQDGHATRALGAGGEDTLGHATLGDDGIGESDRLSGEGELVGDRGVTRIDHLQARPGVEGRADGRAHDLRSHHPVRGADGRRSCESETGENERCEHGSSFGTKA